MAVSCFSGRCIAKELFISFSISWFLIFFTSEAAPTYVFHECPNTTTYSPNSIDQANLRSLFSTLSSNTTRNDMYLNATAGTAPSDRAYGLFMCRGDVTPDVCRDCVSTATTEVLQRCPREKKTIIWYEECILRYDNQSFFSILETIGVVYLWNAGNESQSVRLSETLGSTMNTLTARASSDDVSENRGQMKGFATTENNFSSFRTLYNLVQCDPYLSGFDCRRCLTIAVNQLPTCCTGRPGGRVLLPSCYVRYEFYPFYNVAVAPPPSPAPVVPTPPGPTPPTTSGGSGGISKQVIIAIAVAVFFSVLLFAFGICFLLRREKKYEAVQEMVRTEENEISIVESLQYDFSTIGLATNNFSAENKIGEGGFGEVFKGKLPNGQEVAVKRLSRSSGQGAKEFKNEVVLVSKLQHRNLVRLVGFCLEQEEKILIYEFVPNKSLDHFLFDQEKQHLMDWPLRYKIIKGIAQGLLYLHEDSRLRIIHRDLKASNILLDGDMNAKISDFGMARIFGGDQSQENTSRIVGTFGYMSPEYAMHGQFSVKSDVFSFGVLLLEIISGKKNTSFFQEGGAEDLLSHAWKLWRDGTPLDLVDPALGESVTRGEVIRCIQIGLLSVQEDVEKRPTMASVILMLNSYTFTMAVPEQPAFFVRSSRADVRSKLVESDESTSKSMPWSANEVSITQLDPR